MKSEDEDRAEVEGRRSFASWWVHDARKPTSIVMVTLHLLALCVVVPQFFSWSGLIIFFALYWVSMGLGISLCYHRLLTHKSFKTYRWVRAVLTVCGCLAWQGSPLKWVGVHRQHHNKSDTDEDPHSPKHGFAWSHLFWILSKKVSKLNTSGLVKDFSRDSITKFLSKWFWVPQVVLAFALFFVGMYFGGYMLGISWVIWGVAFRIVVVFHITWLVNSATHKWGYRNFKQTKDDSRNLWWVALLTFGEGWHNNHHAKQSSASHGMRWFEIDLTYWTIIAMSWVGLVWDVKHPPKVSTA